MVAVYKTMILKLKCQYLFSALLQVKPHSMLQTTSTLDTKRARAGRFDEIRVWMNHPYP